MRLKVKGSRLRAMMQLVAGVSSRFYSAQSAQVLAEVGSLARIIRIARFTRLECVQLAVRLWLFATHAVCVSRHYRCLGVIAFGRTTGVMRRVSTTRSFSVVEALKVSKIVLRRRLCCTSIVVKRNVSI